MLTDTACRNAKPKEKLYRLNDSKGLYLEVKPNGVKAWRYRFKLRHGETVKASMFAIGNYCAAPCGETAEEAKARRDGGRFTLAEARNARDEARALVKQGISPVQSRKLAGIKRAQAAATTFEAVAREWLNAQDWEAITREKRQSMLERVVFPKIGALAVKDIEPAHILDVSKTAAEENGISVAAQALRTISGIYSLAITTLRADRDPTQPVRGAIPAQRTRHKRPLETEEIGQLLRDVDGYGGKFEVTAAFRLMWLTLCRPSEAVEAQWSEFDLDAALWRIPAERMKRRIEHVIPLPAQAVELLRALAGITGRCTHAFPGRDDRSKPMCTQAFQSMLKAIGWAGKYSPHATRTTGSTRLNELGFAADWIERQLAHAEPNAVRRTYNHARHLPERAKMMQQWADMLDEWKAGNSKVIALHAPARAA